MKHLITIICCLLVILPATAKKRKAKQPKIQKVELKTEADSLAYTFGVVNGHDISNMLKRQDKKIEVNDLIKGIDKTFYTDSTRFSYELGLQMGFAMKQQFEKMDKDSIVVNKNMFLPALYAALLGKETLISKNDAETKIDQFGQEQRKRMNQKAEARKMKEAKENLEAGKRFLAKKEQEPGIYKTASGLLYKVLREGDGVKITPDCKVKVNYIGSLAGGKQFDSSYSRNEPAIFGVTDVIKGWSEGLQLMSKGGKYILYVPSELAYGERGAGSDIGPNSALKFEIEIIDVICPNREDKE
ncbi:FKBP-type peptidyl-prolyl cis-trans isomerase [Coprobacter tertius]|uniref:Peptidyl-prolyl cis-trans isomerase n=1 Tax=Coprobacter tertius TaxID=2944915 RepID=A0ABT1MDL0_9BACT|nr:FKBP-type peptidyl-prolyl cis-trans isomerase [Coprobacter tertius]MCP9610723.1 FKBP-type peptidyl-prolyl cis-trans isomerase [Coprobacter tertius]